MTLSAAYAISANSLQAELFREAPSSLLGGTGVVSLANQDFQVLQNGTPNLSVNVSAGQAWVPGTLSSTTGFPTNFNAQTAYGFATTFNEQGCYYVWNNGTVNLVVPSNSTGSTRNDVVAITIEDAAYAGGANTAVLQYLAGASGGALPTVPASSLVVAQVAVANGASSVTNANITDERPQAALLPGGTPYSCKYHRTVAWVTNSGSHSFGLDTADWDPLAMYNASTGVFTAPIAGLWHFTFFMFVSSSASGQEIQCGLTNGPSGTTFYSTASGEVMTSITDGRLNMTQGATVTTNYSASTASLTGGTGEPIFFTAMYEGALA